MATDDIDLSRAPLLSHLIELRRRLIHCLIAFALLFCISYWASEHIYAFLLQPLKQAFGDSAEGRRMIYTGLHEAFLTYLKLAFFSAVFLSLPLILIQIWQFLAPGLYKHERKAYVPLVVATPLLFFTGGALAFYLVMPMAWDFFIGFETSSPTAGLAVQLEARVSEYLSLVIKLILAFGICFELPVLLLVLAKAGLVTSETLSRYRRHAIVFAFLVAAFLTPPDLISQIALGVPLLLLYELSIVLIRVTNADQQALERERLLSQGLR